MTLKEILLNENVYLKKNNKKLVYSEELGYEVIVGVKYKRCPVIKMFLENEDEALQFLLEE